MLVTHTFLVSLVLAATTELPSFRSRRTSLIPLPVVRSSGNHPNKQKVPITPQPRVAKSIFEDERIPITKFKENIRPTAGKENVKPMTPKDTIRHVPADGHTKPLTPREKVRPVVVDNNAQLLSDEFSPLRPKENLRYSLAKEKANYSLWPLHPKSDQKSVEAEDSMPIPQAAKTESKTDKFPSKLQQPKTVSKFEPVEGTQQPAKLIQKRRSVSAKEDGPPKQSKPKELWNSLRKGSSRAGRTPSGGTFTPRTMQKIQSFDKVEKDTYNSKRKNPPPSLAESTKSPRNLLKYVTTSWRGKASMPPEGTRGVSQPVKGSTSAAPGKPPATTRPSVKSVVPPSGQSSTSRQVSSSRQSLPPQRPAVTSRQTSSARHSSGPGLPGSRKPSTSGATVGSNMSLKSHQRSQGRSSISGFNPVSTIRKVPPSRQSSANYVLPHSGQLSAEGSSKPKIAHARTLSESTKFKTDPALSKSTTIVASESSGRAEHAKVTEETQAGDMTESIRPTTSMHNTETKGGLLRKVKSLLNMEGSQPKPASKSTKPAKTKQNRISDTHIQLTNNSPASRSYNQDSTMQSSPASYIHRGVLMNAHPRASVMHLFDQTLGTGAHPFERSEKTEDSLIELEEPLVEVEEPLLEVRERPLAYQPSRRRETIGYGEIRQASIQSVATSTGVTQVTEQQLEAIENYAHWPTENLWAAIEEETYLKGELQVDEIHTPADNRVRAKRLERQLVQLWKRQFYPYMSTRHSAQRAIDLADRKFGIASLTFLEVALQLNFEAIQELESLAGKFDKRQRERYHLAYAYASFGRIDQSHGKLSPLRISSTVEATSYLDSIIAELDRSTQDRYQTCDLNYGERLHRLEQHKTVLYETWQREELFAQMQSRAPSESVQQFLDRLGPQKKLDNSFENWDTSSLWHYQQTYGDKFSLIALWKRDLYPMIKDAEMLRKAIGYGSYLYGVGSLKFASIAFSLDSEVLSALAARSEDVTDLIAYKYHRLLADVKSKLFTLHGEIDYARFVDYVGTALQQFEVYLKTTPLSQDIDELTDIAELLYRIFRAEQESELYSQYSERFQYDALFDHIWDTCQAPVDGSAYHSYVERDESENEGVA